MKIYTIENETNNITIHNTAKEADAVADAQCFRNEAGFAKLAADWPMARLVEIWNSVPGVTPVNKFKDRATAVSRIWKAVQNLEPAETETKPEEPQPAVVVAGDTAASPVAQEAAIEAAQVGEPIEVAPEAEVPVTVEQPEPKTAETASHPGPELVADVLAADVAPQTPNVVTEEATSTRKASRAKSVQDGNVSAPREGSKTAQVIAMLKQQGGATLDEIMTAMGWQKHTTRAMLSAGGSLTKNHGLVVISEKVGDQKRYSIKA